MYLCNNLGKFVTLFCRYVEYRICNGYNIFYKEITCYRFLRRVYKRIQSCNPLVERLLAWGGGAKPPFFSQIADILLVMLNLFQQFTHFSYSFKVCKVLKQVQDDIETWIISLGASLQVKKGGVGYIKY